MIDWTKQYTHRGLPVRIYADGSDTYKGFIHIAYLLDGDWFPTAVELSDLVEVWQPKEGELCYFWDDCNYIVVGKYADVQYKYSFRLSNNDTGRSFKYCAPFIGTLPEACKGL